MASTSLRVAVLCAVIACAAGTHFRYGTIWWDMDGPTGLLSSGVNIEVEVTFYMQLAFRRDYTWGAYFNEQWRSSNTATWLRGPTGQAINCDTNNIQCFEGTQESIVDNYQIKFPNGQGTNGVPLIPVGSPKICYSPLHKGVNGDWAWDPDTADDCQDRGGYLPPNTPGTGELRCPSPEFEPAYMKTVAPADPNNPSAAVVATDTMEASVCTPWHELVGFYFGDDTYGFPDVDNDPSTQDGPVLTVEGIDSDANSLLGNFIIGSTDPFTHTYNVDSPTADGYYESPVYVAFFTGGNRLSTLVNNADGRYRLETAIKFDFVNRTLINNRSPRASMVPLLAVPYVAYVANTRLGAHFQVMAYDQDYYKPELRDEVRFFLGNSREHGGIQANMVYTLNMADLSANEYAGEYTWFQDYYYKFICARQVAEGATAGVRCQDSRYLGTNADATYTQDNNYQAGSYYDVWEVTRNTPQPPPNLDIDPKTGVVTWETGSGPGLGYDNTQNFGSRTLGDGLVPGFYNLVVMVEERHNGDASMGYPDHIDDNGDDMNDAAGTGFDATMCRDEYDGFDATDGRRPVYSWRDAIIQGTNIDAAYPFGGGENICRASPAAPLPPTVLQTTGAVKVPLDFLLYLYPTMHYCSMGCNMPTDLGGTSCGPWDTDCHSLDSDILATNTMHTFESINGWYGDTGSRSDGLLATSTVSGAIEVTGACKICGGGGRYKEVQLTTSLNPLRTIDYRSVNGSAYCEVPNVDPDTLDGAPDRAGLDATLNADWNAATGLVGNLAFDVLSYDPTNKAGVESGSTASFRYRQLYGSYPFDPQLFPETSYPFSPTGGRGMFPPSRTSGTQVGSSCSTSSTWLSFNEFRAGGVNQADFMFQGCLGTSPGYGVNRFGAVGVGANNPAGSNPFGGVEDTPFLPVEGDNCYVNMPPRFVTFCSCDNVTETNPRYGNTPAMGCTHQMQVKTTEPYLTPDRANLATCCSTSTQMTATASTNSGDLAKYPGMFAPAEVRGLKGSIVTFYLTARDDDQCTELVVNHLGLVDPSMRMEGYLRLDARTVSRKFVWYPRSIANPQDVNLETEVPPTNDLRDSQTLVCFYASDRYEYTALPFHCVQITLENPTSIVWCDQDKDRNPVAGRSELVGEENRIYKAYAGEEFKMPLCVMKRESALSAMNSNLNIWKIHWEDVGGASGHPSDPLNQVFNYPYDEINFPQSGKLSYDEDRCAYAYDIANVGGAYLDPDSTRWYPSSGTDNMYVQASADGSLKGSCQDPLYMTYGFTPSDFEECVYTVCFQGYDELSAPDGVPVDPTLNQVETTDVRCFKIEVYNNVLQFDGQAGALDVEISKTLLPQEGFAMSLWAYPECQSEPTNMTMAYFGSVRDFNPTDACPDRRDTGNEVRNALRFMDMGDGMGRFFYYDIHVGAKMTEQTFCCGKWHHVGVSITDDHQAFLFVDGLTKEDQIKGSRDTIQYEVVDFNTTSRPDHRQDIDTSLSVDGAMVTSSGYLALGYYPGQAFTGYLDEVRVWSRYLTKEEAKEQLHTRSLDYSADDNLRGHYLMGDGRLMTHGNNDFTNGYLPTVIAGQASCHSWAFNAADALANYAMDGRPQTLMKWPSLPSEPVILHKAVPVQIPCVLGMQHAVGPVDGQCVTDVYVWNAADGINPKCMFGGVEMPATWVTDDVIRCETPGHFTPRFVVVKASNDGIRFSDPTPVDKTVQHLFLESSLYVDGKGGGAEADSVCMDIPKRAVSFGGWTCAKCGPPTPDAPPPPSPPPSPPPPSPPPPSPPPPLAGGR